MNTVLFAEQYRWFLHVKGLENLTESQVTEIESLLQAKFAQDLDAAIAAEIKKVVEKKDQHIARLCEEITRLDDRIYHLEGKS